MRAADPSSRGEPTDEELRALLDSARVIAVVGLSPNPDRPSNQVAWYLHHQGYTLYGVNPKVRGDVFGVPVVPTLAEVPEAIDVVDVFRRAVYASEVAQAAVDVGARALWLQQGIRSPEAEAAAVAAGLVFVQDRCLKVEHLRLVSSAGRAR